LIFLESSSSTGFVSHTSRHLQHKLGHKEVGIISTDRSTKWPRT